jgi:hypothetical protein
MNDPVVRHLIPIEGLKVPCRWQVGDVVFHPGIEAASVLGDVPEIEVFRSAGEILASAHDSSIAEVTGPDDIEEALDLVQASLDALRLLQFRRALVRPTSFGLSGDIYQSRIFYVKVAERSGVGGHFRGERPGTGLSMQAYDEWHSLPAFRFLNEALADRNASEGARRACMGTTFFARSSVEHRPDLKLLGAISALDAWLGSSKAPVKRRLSRRVVWFGCARECGNLCGRNRPVCAYLYLDLGEQGKLLSAAEIRGEENLTVRCSEWHQFIESYDLRSSVAHGDRVEVPYRLANEAVYRVSHVLAEPVLEWLGEHRDDPVGDLDRVIAAVPAPDGWSGTIAQLQAILGHRKV